MITWAGAFQALIFFILTLIVLAWWQWPRDEHGKPFSAEDVVKWSKTFPEPPKLPGRIQRKIVMITVFLIGIAIALSKHMPSHNSDDDRP